MDKSKEIYIEGQDQLVGNIHYKEMANNLAKSISSELDSMAHSSAGSSFCIRRVDEKFRSVNELAYTPEIISIGPFHSDNAALRAMEYHKLRYMDALLSRLENRVEKLEECVEAIDKLEDEARAYYSEPVELDKSKFIRMLVVDGLFTIELLRRKSALQESTHGDDPIFCMQTMASLARDMILLENQLPMIVLERLFEITMANQPGGKSLNELAVRFFHPLMKRDESIFENCLNIEAKHLLDLLAKTFHYSPPSTKTDTILELINLPSTKTDTILELNPLLSARELWFMGVEFKKSEHGLLDVRFKDRVLKIPPIHIHDRTESLLRNFIASESCCCENSTYFTSYAIFMAMLIKSSDDVAFLRSRGIITHCLDGDERVFSLFNQLCSKVTLVNFYYADLCEKLNAFSNSFWNFLKSILKRRMHAFFCDPLPLWNFMFAYIGSAAALYGLYRHDGRLNQGRSNVRGASGGKCHPH